MTAHAPVFPIFLRLAGRPVVLVGGGRVAASKLEGLLRAGARVTVVSPEIRSELERDGVTLRRRPFVPRDLDNAWFAVAAATHDVNRQVAEAAEVRRIFVNAVDDPASASAYAGGVFRRGGLTVSISTDGEAPALAGLLREGLEALVPDEIETWLDLSRGETRAWRERAIPMTERRPLLLEALNRLYAGRAR
jgi:siroheme synthase-like protein